MDTKQDRLKQQLADTARSLAETERQIAKTLSYAAEVTSDPSVAERRRRVARAASEHADGEDREADRLSS